MAPRREPPKRTQQRASRSVGFPKHPRVRETLMRVLESHDASGRPLPLLVNDPIRFGRELDCAASAPNLRTPQCGAHSHRIGAAGYIDSAFDREDGVVPFERHKARLPIVFSLELPRGAFPTLREPSRALIREKRDADRIISSYGPPVREDRPSRRITEA